MSSGNESDAEPIYTYMLENIRDGSQYLLSINGREARYKIRDIFKQRQGEWKGALLYTQNMGKGLHKVSEAISNNISQALPILDESVSEVSYFIPEPKNFSEVIIL